jgi:hypothetical protein
MPSTISSFSSVIDQIQKSIKDKKEGILHPIRRLPTEILLHIFEDCVNDEIDEYHRNPPSIFEACPTMALCLASVCSRWRDILLGTPHLWRHLRLRAPTQFGSPGARNHFQNYLDRCRGSAIELTIPSGGEFSDDLLPDTITVQRLNLSEDIQQWPIVPSPIHLWLYCPAPASICVIPTYLISRTTHLTVCNVGILLQEDFQSLTRLEICGVHPAFGFTRMISQSPHLTDLDLIKSEIQGATFVTPVSLTHLHLRYLGLSRGWINRLESALSSGLHLPQLRHLKLSDITSEYIATKYPHISAQLGATVVRLDFQGEDCSLDATRSFVDAFRKINTIGCYGTVTETVLRAIYEVRLSRVPTPGELTNRCTREIFHTIPKGLDVVIICNYEGEGRKIEQQLQMMRQNPAADTQPINVVFENCLNILSRIRREFAVPGPPIAVESVDPHLGPGQSNCDPGDANDRTLDQLEAVDGLSG